MLQGVASTIVEAETLVKPIRDRDWLAIDKIELFFRPPAQLACETRGQ